MELKNDILQGLILQFEAYKAKAKVSLDNYLYNSVGIGEHPDIMAECIKCVHQIGEADSALKTLNEVYADELR